MVRVVDLIRRGAERFPNRTAVVHGSRSLTYREVNDTASRCSQTLLGQGLRPGDHIGLLTGNGLWSMSIEFACAKAGLVRVPLNPRLSTQEHRQMVEGTATRWLLHDPARHDAAGELVGMVDDVRVLGVGGAGVAGAPDLLDLAAEASPAEPALPLRGADPLLLLHTSGTTGMLKAATHTQGSYAAIATNILANLLSPGRDAVMLHAAPLVHASGTFLLPYWLRGGTAVVEASFDPDSFLASIERHHVTEINLVPTMLGLLLADRPHAVSVLAQLRTVVYGASPMPRPLLERVLDEVGPIFRQYYGQTEAPLCISVLDEADHRDPELRGSCGHPAVDAEVRVVDDDDHDVSAGTVGEVQVRAPFQMIEYYRAPERTADTFTADGFVRTRDMAVYDERGYLHLVDRRSDMIVTGGYNVYPREVEDALRRHPAVLECAVVGAPDPTWVEAVTAVVQLVPGGSATEADLQATVRAQLAGYKVPKRVQFVDQLPLSGVGKVLRRAVREPLWQDAGGALQPHREE